ncbi:MAG: copper transporter [Acidimicrobiia bacterium]|nr:copper transporter [Acidimicrobiia bacterium]
MVTFRFYLVSLVAVFLALAMGVVVGSTLIDRAIVDRLDRSVRTVRDRASRVQDENDRLEEELADLREYTDVTASSVVAGTLEGGSVVVVAERGLQPEPVQSAVSLLGDAGAESPGILWLERGWVLDDEEEREALAGALDVPVTDADRLRDRAWRRVVAELQGGSATGEPLQDLVDGGFLTYEGVGEEPSELADLAGTAEAAVLVSGPASELGDGGLVVGMGRVLVDAEVDTVVAEVWRDTEEGPARGAVVGRVRDAEDLSEAVSTVDDLDLLQGRVAAALAVAELVEDGRRGDYGYGRDVDGVLPERTAAE